MRQPAPSWGPACRCTHARLIHRGTNHEGECAALQCAISMDVTGWSKISRCAEFVEVAE